MQPPFLGAGTETGTAMIRNQSESQANETERELQGTFKKPSDREKTCIVFSRSPGFLNDGPRWILGYSHGPHFSSEMYS